MAGAAVADSAASAWLRATERRACASRLEIWARLRLLPRGQGRDERPPRGDRGAERARGLRRRRGERTDLRILAPELAREPGERRLRLLGLRGDALVLERRPVQVVEARDRLVERLRPEDDCQRILPRLLVERVEPERELPLGDLEVVARDAETVPDGGAVTRDPGGFRAQRRQARLGPSELGIERIETEEGSVRAGCHRGVGTAKRIGALLQLRRRFSAAHRCDNP